ncbi:MAG: hypothetical protein ABIG89_02270 [Candidatus Woesearchaeota archaeon]
MKKKNSKLNNSKLRDEYAKRALSQIPRLLTLLDRNEFSKTYGSFQRTFWLDKSDDFVNALPQYGVISLALVYNFEMPGNIYYHSTKIRRWAIAAMMYWTKVQHKDGSFDEFYPNERGWAGPTGFLLFSMAEAFKIFKESMTKKEIFLFLKACKKAAIFLGKYDESGVLANHNAIALLGIYEAYTILGDHYIMRLFNKQIKVFYSLVSKEGWSLEYDGPDIGYLSATVSFLSRIYKLGYRDNKILKVIEESINFSSYFVYPNNYYAGSLGSRQTLHFYPHGYEIMADRFPLAGRIADRMLMGIRDGKLVSPEIQADRYFLYRIPEFLLSYLDYNHERKSNKALLPFEKDDFSHYYKHAGIYIRKTRRIYFLCNLNKGGVIKAFNLENNKLIFNDDCIVGMSIDGDVLTSQWIDTHYRISVNDNSISVEGKMNYLPQKVFTPFKGLIFRTIILLLGWNTFLAYHLKGIIRKMIIFGKNRSNVSFIRQVFFGDYIEVKDHIINNSGIMFNFLKIGGCTYLRYVPQSRFFQPIELDIDDLFLDKDELNKFNDAGVYRLTRKINI